MIKEKSASIDQKVERCLDAETRRLENNTNILSDQRKLAPQVLKNKVIEIDRAAFKI